MADVALPAVDVDAACFAEVLGGVGVEVGGAVGVAAGEVE